MAAHPARHQIQLTCPECGHAQNEPGMVVSTSCRACGAHLQVKDGKAVGRSKAVTRFSPPKKRPAETATAEPESAKALFPFRKPDLQLPPPGGFFRRWFGKLPRVRRVVCFDCGREHTAVPAAQSSQCPYCSGYISLRDYTIHERWNRRIQTRGNVVISRNGSISGATIVCHDLTVSGELSAPVECSGDLRILHHGKIPGKVRCHTLRVERGARVEFLNGVEARDVFVNGRLTGRVSCTGTVVIEKRAEIRGLIRAARIQVKQGAKHSGTIEIVEPPDPEEAPSGFGGE